jgi:perosamine synthetase
MEPYKQLEWNFANWLQCSPEQVVACSSGTAALHLALESLRLPQSSTVLTGDFNMIAVPRAIVAAGLTPMFVDCNATLNMDMSLMGDALPKSAVVITHIYGRRCDVDQLMLKRTGEMFVIEDLAEVHGVMPHSLTDAACWSFYKNKVIHGEEGGAVMFKDVEHAVVARQLRCLGFTDAHDFNHVPRGWNHRMSNLHALPILDSLRDVHSNLQRRREIEGWYDALCPQEWKMPKRDSVWVYDMRIPGLTAIKQVEIVNALNAACISARLAFKPMSNQMEFKNCKKVRKLTMVQNVIEGKHYSDSLESCAEVASRETLLLPVVPGHTTEFAIRLTFDIIERGLTQTG